MIDINQSLLGSDYLQALTKSMKHLDPKEVKVNNIKEKESDIISIISNLKRSKQLLDRLTPKIASKLNFSGSRLGLSAIQKI